MHTTQNTRQTARCPFPSTDANADCLCRRLVSATRFLAAAQTAYNRNFSAK
ncbi:MAG: hypothetical protein LBS59_04935 [Puniceicoccales bacterium]|nr:hypothetical protein [Puniceicoccales bacterium]